MPPRDDHDQDSDTDNGKAGDGTNRRYRDAIKLDRLARDQKDQGEDIDRLYKTTKANEQRSVENAGDIKSINMILGGFQGQDGIVAKISAMQKNMYIAMGILLAINIVVPIVMTLISKK